MLADTPILTLAKHDVHRGGVRRSSDGTLWIAHWQSDSPGRVAGTQLTGLQPARIDGDDWSIIGGQLPPGATTVDVLADDGRWYPAQVTADAWVTFIPHGVDTTGCPPARFRDSMGALVSRVTAQSAARAQPIDPAVAELMGLDSCPVCGHRDWQVEPAEHGTGWVSFCGTCGHTDGGSWTAYAPIGT